MTLVQRGPMNIPGADETQKCPKCKKDCQCTGAVGFTNEGVPMGAQYEEYYTCYDCDHRWVYQPYIRR